MKIEYALLAVGALALVLARQGASAAPNLRDVTSEVKLPEDKTPDAIANIAKIIETSGGKLHYVGSDSIIDIDTSLPKGVVTYASNGLPVGKYAWKGTALNEDETIAGYIYKWLGNGGNTYFTYDLDAYNQFIWPVAVHPPTVTQPNRGSASEFTIE